MKSLGRDLEMSVMDRGYEKGTPIPNFVQGAFCLSSVKISLFFYFTFYIPEFSVFLFSFVVMFLLSCFRHDTTLKRQTACSQRGCQLHRGRPVSCTTMHNTYNKKHCWPVRDGHYELFTNSRPDAA